MHSTEWVIQVAQRPPGTSEPLPDASRESWCLYTFMTYSELGKFFNLGRGLSNRNSHFLLLQKSQALALLGFDEDMGVSD